MSSVLLSHTNGSSAHHPNHWMKQSVQQFFGGFNWEDNPPEVQEITSFTLKEGSDQPLSLKLSVSQFFNAINWNGRAIAAPPAPDPLPPQAPKVDAFTLDDFSDLF